MARFRPPFVNIAFVFLTFMIAAVDFLFASPQLITFQSKIFKPDGSALEAGAVSFRLSVTDPVGSCVIYQEDFVGRNMSGTKGLVTLTLGGGSKVFPAGPMTLVEVFNNYNFPSLNCQAGGSVVAGPSDRRKVVMQFNDGSGWQTAPSMDINSNPFAMQALVAQKLGDYPANDYLRTAQLPTCLAPGDALHFNGTSITCITPAGGGGGSVTAVSSANLYLSVANGTSTPSLTLNVGTAANTVAAGDDSRITGAAQKSANLSDLSNAATARTNLGLGTAATLNVGTGNNNVVQLDGSARLPAVDGSQLTGVVASNIADNAITNAKLADNAVNTAEIADGAVTNGKLAGSIDRTKLASGSNNHVVINDGSGVLSSEAQLAVARGGTGTNSFSANQLVGVNGTGSGLMSFTCGDGQVIKFNALGAAVCGTDNNAGGTGDIMNGGNTGAVVIGTNDVNSLTFETSNAAAMTILSDGKVGIGTVTPGAKLDVTSSNTFYGSKFTHTAPGGSFGTTLYAVQGGTMASNSAIYAESYGNAVSVYGWAADAGFSGVGVHGDSWGAGTGIGVKGTSVAANNTGYAVQAINNSATGWGVYSSGTSPNYFNGNVGIGTNGSVPETKLDVRGTASAEAITEGSAAYVNSGAAYTIPDSTLSVRRIDLTNNTTLTLPAFTSTTTRVYTLTIFLRQDGTGSRTVTWAGAGNTIKWDGGAAPTISANANKITIIQLTKVSDEAVWYGSMVWKED